MEYKKLATTLLINKCLERDPLAWAEFVGRFSRLMAFSIKRTLKECSSYAVDENAKDILQNLLMSFWNDGKLSSIKNRENINYWLIITSRNAAVNSLRKTRKEVISSDESCFNKLPAENNFYNINKRKDMDKKIEKIYSSLSSKEKLIFKLHFEKELILKDISKIMNMPIGTVSSMITRTRKKIKCREI